MNISDYVGLQYKEKGREVTGCDCYGLVRILYKDFKNIILPKYENVEADKAIHNMIILKEQKKWEEVFNPKFGDGICFNIIGFVSHVGMMIDKTNFIHSWKGTDSCIESINSISWRHRINGFFRYKN